MKTFSIDRRMTREERAAEWQRIEEHVQWLFQQWARKPISAKPAKNKKR